MARKIGRNEPCPCGSGRKYKKCHATSKTMEVIPLNVFQKLNENIQKNRLEKQNLVTLDQISQPISKNINL